MWEVLRDHWLLLLVGPYPYGPIGGLVGTFALAVLGLLLSLPCALALALGQVSRWTVARECARLVVFTMRATPLLMIIFWMYFLLPVILGTGIPSFVIMLTALVLYESAYLSRI